MTDELYINGQRVDISESGIFLDYRSHLVFDIKSLIASHSYTIKLPKTANNLRLIDGAAYVSSTSLFPYLKHKAQLFRDGIMLIDDCDVALVSVGEDIEISLVWGKYPKLEAMQDINLNEMPYEQDNAEDNREYYSWYGTATDGTDTRSQDINFPQLELGQRWRNNFRHPVISLYDIMRKIGRYYNVAFDYPSEAENRLKSLVLPVLERNVAPHYSQSFTMTGARERLDSYRELPLIDWSIPTEVYEYLSIAEGVVKDYPKPFVNRAWNASYKVRIRGEVRLQVLGSGTQGFVHPEEMFIIIKTRNVKFNTQGEGNYGEEEVTRTALYRLAVGSDYDTYTIDDEMELPVLYTDSLMQFYIVSNAAVDNIYLRSGGALQVTFTPSIAKVEPFYSNAVITLPNINYYYYLVPNLPKIKIVDFVKSVAQVFGWFCYEKDDTIIFRPYDILSENIAIAEDWSDYYIEGSETLSFVVDDALTKKNKFVFANADDYPETSATIELDAETLSSKETNYVESKFSAASNNAIGGNAFISVYTYNDDWDAEKQSIYDRWEYSNDDKAYLLTRTSEQSGNNTYYSVKFRESWSNILANYWQTYISMINGGKLITCMMRLSPIVLRKIDFSVPIYLRQHGAYFVVQQVKTKDNDLSEVKLIKLS